MILLVDAVDLDESGEDYKAAKELLSAMGRWTALRSRPELVVFSKRKRAVFRWFPSLE